MSQELPRYLSVYTVESLFIIYEVDVEGEFHSSDCFPFVTFSVLHFHAMSITFASAVFFFF